MQLNGRTGAAYWPKFPGLSGLLYCNRVLGHLRVVKLYPPRCGVVTCSVINTIVINRCGVVVICSVMNTIKNNIFNMLCNKTANNYI